MNQPSPAIEESTAADDPAARAAGEAAERTRLLAHLTGIGLPVTIVDYPAHSTIDEGKRLRGDLPGTFTKNLLLRDKKGALFFVTAHEDTEIDLRTLHGRVGGRGRLGFAPAETMAALLRVVPGTATPLALINDTAGAVTLVVDEVLVGADQLNFHPMTHTESIGLSWPDFLVFARSCDHEPLVADLTGPDSQD